MWVEVVHVGGGVKSGEGVAESIRTNGEGGGAGMSEDISVWLRRRCRNWG